MRNPIINTPGYQMIKEFYGDRVAMRSQVPLINHIHEGIEILCRYGANELEMEAYAAHPVFQPNDDLANTWPRAAELDPMVMTLVMEYRNIANAYLSPKIKLSQNWYDLGKPTAYASGPIALSPIPGVNVMLVADKVQNRKDFERYHKDSHVRSIELDFYFRFWLKALEISEEQYNELIEGL